MRVIAGIDEDGHQFIIRADTFERVKKYFIECLMSVDKDLALKAAIATTEAELLENDELMDTMNDYRFMGAGRDNFSTIYDPLEKK